MNKELTLKVLDKYLNDYLSTQEDIEAFGYARECVENGIVWHPYPDEKPKDLNDKLVTIRESSGNRYTTIGFYDEGQWYGREGFWMPNNRVTAWAELPEPYRRENAE